MSLWDYANPRRFLAITDKVVGPAFVLAVAALVIGLTWGFFFTPDDFRQGASVKIIYLHVPSAMMAINIWVMMLVASLVWLIRRHHVSALAAKAAAPVGVTMTVIALLTGAVWGQPIWGTWWVWDPRLTSFLILFLFYVGYMALWSAVEDPDTAADLTSVLCLVGSVFALLSRYAAAFWSQGQHQGSSIFRAEEVVNPDAPERMSNVFFLPLMVCIVGFILLFIALVLMRTRTEIQKRRVIAITVRERRA